MFLYESSLPLNVVQNQNGEIRVELGDIPHSLYTRDFFEYLGSKKPQDCSTLQVPYFRGNVMEQVIKRDFPGVKITTGKKATDVDVILNALNEKMKGVSIEELVYAELKNKLGPMDSVAFLDGPGGYLGGSDNAGYVGALVGAKAEFTAAKIPLVIKANELLFYTMPCLSATIKWDGKEVDFVSSTRIPTDDLIAHVLLGEDKQTLENIADLVVEKAPLAFKLGRFHSRQGVPLEIAGYMLDHRFYSFDEEPTFIQRHTLGNKLVLKYNIGVNKVHDLGQISEEIKYTMNELSREGLTCTPAAIYPDNESGRFITKDIYGGYGFTDNPRKDIVKRIL